MTVPIPEAAHHLLDDVNYAHVVTLFEDGSPQTTPVWVARDGAVVILNTAKGRTKHRNLVRDPRIALSVHQHDNPYEYLQVRGTAELVDSGAREHIDELSRKYTGGDYGSLQPGEERVIIRVSADHMQHSG